MSVELNYVFTGNVARICNRYAYLIVAVRNQLGRVVPLNLPIERSVRQTVAEGELHYPVISFAVLVFYVSEISFRIRSFIPLIAEIDAFLIGKVVAVFNCVEISGVVGLVIVRKRVARSARRVYFTLYDAGNGSHTGLPRYAYMYARLYAGIVV